MIQGMTFLNWSLKDIYELTIPKLLLADSRSDVVGRDIFWGSG